MATPGFDDVRFTEFVYYVAEHQLDLQLDRYRDVLTLSLGLIAAALAAVAFVVVDKASWIDVAAAGLLTVGGVLSGIALFYGWDADVAPDAEELATSYDGDPELLRADATAAILATLRDNEIWLRRKMIMVRLALLVILVASIVGIGSKVVESRW